MITTSILPWLTIRARTGVSEFYRQAFAAIEVYRLEDPEGGFVARLSVEGAEFWISTDTSAPGEPVHTVDPAPVRMILTVESPDEVYDAALKAGAREVYPITEEHGWRIGRIEDPFGHHWEIGRPTGQSL